MNIPCLLAGKNIHFCAFRDKYILLLYKKQVEEKENAKRVQVIKARKLDC